MLSGLAVLETGVSAVVVGEVVAGVVAAVAGVAGGVDCATDAVCALPKQPPPNPVEYSPAKALLERKTPNITNIKALGIIISFAVCIRK